MPFDDRSSFGGARGDLEPVERSGYPERRRAVGRLAGLVVLAAIATFCLVQDAGTSAGVGRYISAQRLALAGQGPRVTVDEIMGPANRLAVREGMAWSGRVAIAGVIALLIYRRVRLKPNAPRQGGRRG